MYGPDGLKRLHADRKIATACHNLLIYLPCRLRRYHRIRYAQKDMTLTVRGMSGKSVLNSTFLLPRRPWEVLSLQQVYSKIESPQDPYGAKQRAFLVSTV